MKEKELERLTNLKIIENELHTKGFKNICGIDEAGRGPLAGPVVVAGVIMPADSMIEGVNDSKKVSEKKRELLYDKIIEEANGVKIDIEEDGTVCIYSIEGLDGPKAKKMIEEITREIDTRLQTKIKHKKLDREVSYEYLIRLEIYKLIKHLLEDEEYEGFKMWW